MHSSHMTGNSSLYRYGLVLLIGILACLLMMLSWPRLQASLKYQAVDTAFSNYWKTREFDNTQLDGLLERTEETIAIHDHYRYWGGLSELHILSGQDMSRSFWQRREALQQSIVAAQESVKRSPANPRSWLRIARARDFLAYPAEQVLPALKMSILTGRVEPTIMLTRLELALRYLPAIAVEDVSLLRDQVQLTWAIHKRPMLKRIKSGSLNLGQLREVLSGNNPDMMSEMEAHLAK